MRHEEVRLLLLVVHWLLLGAGALRPGVGPVCLVLLGLHGAAGSPSSALEAIECDLSLDGTRSDVQLQ